MARNKNIKIERKYVKSPEPDMSVLLNEDGRLKVKLDGGSLSGKTLMVGTPMYGGKCDGPYCKSVSSLVALGKDLGVRVDLYFLFNESLITRARNYVCEAFLQSGDDYLIFLDSDITFRPQDIFAMLIIAESGPGWDVMCAPYPKKSYAASTKVLTEDGEQSIKTLVDTKYNKKVLSLNTLTNKLEWKNVLNWSVSDYNPGKNWVKLGRHGRKNLTITEDHGIMVTDDPLNPSFYECPVMNSDGKYIGRNPVDNGKNSINSVYSREQLEFLYGTLLGDGCITNDYLKFGHCEDQLSYLKLKQRIFGGKISEKRKSGSYNGKDYFAYHMDCPRNGQIEYLSNIFYVGNHYKTVKNISSNITEKSLAFWYMDDGTLRENGSVVLCTENFDYNDHEIMKLTFKENFDINVNIINHGNSHRIYIPVDEATKFFELIAPYVKNVMDYKLPSEFSDVIPYDYNNLHNEDFGLEKVEYHYVENKKYKQYDIMVEDNYNFIAENYISHNCISWEKIKVAVENGIVDDPNELAMFAGDFVFNPVSGAHQLPLGKPFEISEGGTGYMLIPRETFTRFLEYYPEKTYKPDHVRSEAFDGHKEIGLFFDCCVDPTTKRYLSEDYNFSQMVRKAGMRVWMCPWVPTEHTGTYTFSGSLGAIARAGVSPTADSSMLVKKKNPVSKK